MSRIPFLNQHIRNINYLRVEQWVRRWRVIEEEIEARNWWVILLSTDCPIIWINRLDAGFQCRNWLTFEVHSLLWTIWLFWLDSGTKNFSLSVDGSDFWKFGAEKAVGLHCHDFSLRPKCIQFFIFQDYTAAEDLISEILAQLVRGADTIWSLMFCRYF